MQSWILAVAVFAGLVFPSLAHLLAPLFDPSLFTVILFALLALEPEEWLEFSPLTWKLAAVLVILQMFAVPGLIGVVSVTFDAGPWVDLLVLIVAASSLFGAPAFAHLIGLPRPLVLAGVLVSTLLLPLSVVIALWWGNDTGFLFDGGAYIQRVGLYLALPILIATVYHVVTRQYIPRLSATFVNGSVLTGLIVFAIAVMDGVTERFFESPTRAGLIALAALLLHGTLFVVGYLMARWIRPTLGMQGGVLFAYRNVGLLAVVSGASASRDFMLFVAIWQIPMYVSPLLLQLWGRRSGR